MVKMAYFMLSILPLYFFNIETKRKQENKVYVISQMCVIKFLLYRHKNEVCSFYLDLMLGLG